MLRRGNPRAMQKSLRPIFCGLASTRSRSRSNASHQATKATTLAGGNSPGWNGPDSSQLEVSHDTEVPIEELLVVHLARRAHPRDNAFSQEQLPQLEFLGISLDME